MNSLKELRFKGLKELRDNGLKDLKASNLKDMILKPKTADANMEDMEDLTKSREEVKKKIRKLLKEKKEIETRIERARKSETALKSETEKFEEISEFPWREEIFPPLPQKVRVKIPETPDVKNASLHEVEPGVVEPEVSEVKAGGLEIVVKGMVEKPENKKPEDKKPEDKKTEDKKTEDKKTEDKKTEDKKLGDIIEKTDNPKEITIISETEEADPKNITGEQDEDKTLPKTLPEEEEKIKNVYPFSAVKLNENIISSENSSSISIEKEKTEKNPVANLFGNDLLEELLNSEELNPEEEQGFIKYLEEPKVGELVTDLKNAKALLVRAGHKG